MKSVIISRTDNLGDVMLTLPMAGLLKGKFPGVKIYFIGKGYTKALIEACRHVDAFLNREDVIKNPALLKTLNADCIIHVFPDKEIAKAASIAKVKKRIGTSHRLFHWLYCNKLINFSRKKSDLHEAQLNIKLLKPIGISEIPTLETIQQLYGFNAKPLKDELKSLLSSSSQNIVFHPKSKGSAREWPINYYFDLATLLKDKNFHIYITGTDAEGQLIKSQLPEIFNLSNVTNLAGKLTLEELVSFISQCNGLVACSTGPLHIASALGINALGIYPPMKPIHPGRWAPVGKKATHFVLNKNCSDCKISQNCHCIQSIDVKMVYDHIISNWKY